MEGVNKNSITNVVAQKPLRTLRIKSKPQNLESKTGTNSDSVMTGFNYNTNSFDIPDTCKVESQKPHKKTEKEKDKISNGIVDTCRVEEPPKPHKKTEKEKDKISNGIVAGSVLLQRLHNKKEISKTLAILATESDFPSSLYTSSYLVVKIESQRHVLLDAFADYFNQGKYILPIPKIIEKYGMEQIAPTEALQGLVVFNDMILNMNFVNKIILQNQNNLTYKEIPILHMTYDFRSNDQILLDSEECNRELKSPQARGKCFVNIIKSLFELSFNSCDEDSIREENNELSSKMEINDKMSERFFYERRKTSNSYNQNKKFLSGMDQRYKQIQLSVDVVTLDGLLACLATIKYPHYLWLSGHPFVPAKQRNL